MRIHEHKILFCSLQFFSGITCPGTVPFHEKNAIHDFLLTTNHRWHAQISPAATSRFFLLASQQDPQLFHESVSTLIPK